MSLFSCLTKLLYFTELCDYGVFIVKVIRMCPGWGRNICTCLLLTILFLKSHFITHTNKENPFFGRLSSQVCHTSVHCFSKLSTDFSTSSNVFYNIKNTKIIYFNKVNDREIIGDFFSFLR